MLVIGATPAQLDQVLRRGIPVTVLARRKREYPAGVRVVTGDVKFPASLADALEGETVVLSLLRGGDVHALSLAARIRGMKDAGVRRLLAVSGPLDDGIRASGLETVLVSGLDAALDTLEA
jgi:putative NADH-flavin reductase